MIAAPMSAATCASLLMMRVPRNVADGSGATSSTGARFMLMPVSSSARPMVRNCSRAASVSPRVPSVRAEEGHGFQWKRTTVPPSTSMLTSMGISLLHASRSAAVSRAAREKPPSASPRATFAP